MRCPRGWQRSDAQIPCDFARRRGSSGRRHAACSGPRHLKERLRMRTTSLIAGFVLGASLVAGCTDDGSDKPDQSDVKGGPDGKAEAWGSSDNPALFNSTLEYKVSALPMTGQATNIPWAGNYW